MAKKINRTELAGKYAQALLQDAIEHDAADVVAAEIGELGALMSESPEFNRLMMSGLVGAQARKTGTELVAEKIGLSELVRNFLGVLIENGRTSFFKEIETAFTRLYEEHKGILSVSVVSAQSLNERTQQHLTDVLKNIFDKEIRLNVTVDPDLIGGLTVQVGSVMADVSVKTKLQKLNLVMKGVGI